MALTRPGDGLRQLGPVRAFGLALLIVALWMVTRPYQGIVEDSRFYTVEALSALSPGRFDHDLYFQFGSQGRFTIFPLLYKPLIAFFGLAGGNIALIVAAQCLWVSGLSYLAFVLFRDWKLTIMAAAAAILLPSGYLLHYGEPFVTPRSFAEALTLWGLAGLLKGHPIRALTVLGVSMLIHPLMTLPGLAVWFLYQAKRWPILWLIAVGIVAAVCALALVGIQPFSRLFVRFDPAWFEIIRTRENFCFVGLWGLGQWLPILGSFALGGFEFSLATPRERDVLTPVLAVGAGGVLVSFLGGDLLHNVLLFDIQTWRSLWLLVLVANLFAVKTFLHFAGTNPSRMAVGLVASALGLMVISQFFTAEAMGAAALLITAMFVGCWEWTTKRPISPALRVLVALLIGCSLGVILVGARLGMNSIHLDPTDFWKSLRALGLSLGISIAIWLFLFQPEILPLKKSQSVLLLVAALGLALIAGWQWDQRTPWTRFVDTADPPPDLVASLPARAPIYWENDVAVPWFLLRRSSHFSCAQGTGVLFSRGTAIAYAGRYKDFEKLQTLDFGQFPYCPLSKTRSDPLRNADLSALCAKEPQLGALVLTQRVADAPNRVWIPPAPFKMIKRSGDGTEKAVSADRFYIYTCADLH